MRMTAKHAWLVLLVGLVGLIGLSACGDGGADAQGLPPLDPTVTALPPSTPTDVPAPEPIDLPAVDWDEIDKFREAMRDEYRADIDEWIDGNRYYIEATLTFENQIALITGAERVRYTNHSPDTLDRIVFRLYPNLPAFGGRMVVYRAAVNDVPVEPSLMDNQSTLILHLDEPLPPGESVEMMLEFSLTAERGMNASYGQYGFQKNVYSGPEWYPMLSVYEPESGWWMDRPSTAGDAVFSETGLYETYLTVPENFVVAMSGTELDRFPAGDGMMTHHVVSGPMRDSLVVAGPEFGVVTDYVDDIAINVYYWPGDEGAAEEVMRIATDSVRVFNEKFGPYPFKELDVAETFNFTGIEYPGIIVIADRNWERGNNFMETTVAHEVAHQWWYSIIGNDQVNHPWLDESLTSYSEYIYAREVYDEEREKDARTSDRDAYNYYRGSGAPDLKLNLPVLAYQDNNYGMIIYVKGPLFYAELEQMLGTDRFLDAVQTYFERHKYTVVESQDVLNAFEDSTGEELDRIFYQWVGSFPGLDQEVVAQMQAQEEGTADLEVQ